MPPSNVPDGRSNLPRRQTLLGGRQLSRQFWNSRTRFGRCGDYKTITSYTNIVFCATAREQRTCIRPILVPPRRRRRCLLYTAGIVYPRGRETDGDRVWIGRGKKIARESSPALAENPPNETAAPNRVARALQVRSVTGRFRPVRVLRFRRFGLRSKGAGYDRSISCSHRTYAFPYSRKKNQILSFLLRLYKIVWRCLPGVETAVSETTFARSEARKWVLS